MTDSHLKGKLPLLLILIALLFVLVIALVLIWFARRDSVPYVEKPAEHYHLTMDEMLLKVADRVPEFGGMFLDKDGVLNVYLLDPDQLAPAQRAIAEVFGSDVLPEAGVKTVTADYGFRQLFAWHRAHRMDTLADPGVISVSIQEMTNRLKVRVDSAETKARVEQTLIAAGVPPAAAEIVLSTPFDYLQPTVQDTSRPLIGGQRIARSVSACTLAFLAVRDGNPGFVTNSHCQAFAGGLTGTIWHQATVASGGANQVGREKIDPDYFWGGDCPSGRVCRRSDSAFVERSAAPGLTPPTAEFDAIALPSNYSGGGMTIDTMVRIRKKQPHAICGQSMQKIGWRTGSTTGTVTDTCVDAGAPDNRAYLCQTVLEIGAAKGDSGSPVFTWSSATLPQGAKPTATLYGILSGGNADGEATYSPINFIEAELGFLRTHRFEGGANSPPAVAILSPSDGANVGVGGLAIETFRAGLSDWEDGEACCNVQWDSDVDGHMGGGATLDYAFTTPGTRNITVTATDSDGDSASATITLKTLNDAPTVTIASPAGASSVYEGAPVLLQGSGYDVNEPFQQLACNMLVWSSNNPNDSWQLNDCMGEVTFSTAGPRAITLTGTDSGGLKDQDSVNVNVLAPPPGGTPPNVLILNPTSNSAHAHNAQVTLMGKITDLEASGQVSYEWVLRPSGNTQLAGGVTQISLGTGTAQSGQQITTPWTPANHVLSHPGGTPVKIGLHGTDNDGTSIKEVLFVVMFPPS